MRQRDALIWTAALVGLALVAPHFLYPLFLMRALCLALFACAFNLLLGYVGLLSFGHAAFMGGAAYITAHTVKVWSFPPELGILAGVAVAALLGLVFGWLAIRRQGIYFAMITLALAQMVAFFALEAPFTGGEDGIQAVPRGHLFGLIDLDNTLPMYYFVLAVFLVGFAIIQRTVNSPFGQVPAPGRTTTAFSVCRKPGNKAAVEGSCRTTALKYWSSALFRHVRSHSGAAACVKLTAPRQNRNASQRPIPISRRS